MIHYLGHDGVRTIVFPVQTVHVPLNHMVSQSIGGFDQRVVIVAVRRTEQKHVFAGQLFDFIVYFLDLVFAFFRTQLGHLLVIFTVISQIMSCVRNRFYIFRIRFYPSSGHEKCSFNVVLCQDGEKIVGVFISPGECHIAEYECILFICAKNISLHTWIYYQKYVKIQK